MSFPLTGPDGHRSLLAAILATVLLTAAVAGGIGATIEHASTDGVRAGLAERAGADRAVRLSLPLADDAEAQDAAVRALLDESFADVQAPIEVSRHVQGAVDAANLDATSNGSLRAAVAASIPDLAQRADLVAGAWPVDSDEVAVQADAAEALGLSAGSRLRVGDAEVRVAALWRVSDPLDPRWLSDELDLLGRDDDGFGPIVVDPALWPELGGTPMAAWTLVPDATRITPADLREFDATWRSLGLRWRGEIADAGDLTRSGAFDATARELSVLVDGLFAVQPVALLLLAAIGLLTLGELARLIAAGRADETTLRWARGTTPGVLALRAAAEAGAVAAIGGALGAGVAFGFGATPAQFVGPALLGAVAAGVAVGLATHRIAAARADPRRRRLDARSARVAGWSAAVLLAGAAALATWQLRLYGSPVVPDAAGGGAVDPVAVAAPVLLLVAGVVLALALFPLVARAADRRGSEASAPLVLALAGVARLPLRAAASISVVALAAGSVLIAAGYAGTWGASFEDASRLRTGAAVGVHVPGAGLRSATLDAVDAAAGVDAVAPVVVTDLVLGETSGDLIAATPDAITALTRPSEGFDPATVAREIAVDPPGMPVPEAARTVDLRLSLEGIASPPEVVFQVLTRLGRVIPVATTSVEAVADDPAAGIVWRDYTGTLPTLAADEAVAVLSLDLAFAPDATTDGSRVGLESAGTDGALAELDGYWAVATATYSDGLVSSVGPTTIALGADVHRARLTATFTGALQDGRSAPVVISRALADRYDLAIDDAVEVVLPATASVHGTVVAVVPAIPGAPVAAALLLDATVVRQAELTTFRDGAVADLWIGSDDPATAVAALRPLLPPDARVRDASDPAARTVLGAAVVALVVAAGAAVLLAVSALLAAGAADRAGRAAEVGVLRALGFRPRDQARARLVERAAGLGFGLVAGVVVGLLVVLVAIGPFAIAAVPRAPSGVAASLAVDPVLLASGFAALGVGLLALLVTTAVGARRDARTAVVGGNPS